MNISILQSAEFQAGVFLATVVLATAIVSPPFRTISLSLLGGAVLWVLYAQGPAGIVAVVKTFRWELVGRPLFSQGLAAGIMLAAIVLFAVTQRKNRS